MILEWKGRKVGEIKWNVGVVRGRSGFLIFLEFLKISGIFKKFKNLKKIFRRLGVIFSEFFQFFKINFFFKFSDLKKR